MTDTNNDLAVKTNFQPEDLVSLTGESITTTSLKVATLFNKQHYHVTRDIKNLISNCSPDFANTNFGVRFKNNELQNNKPQEYFEVTKDGFIFIAMGYTGEKAVSIKEAYIKAFNQRMFRRFQRAQFYAG